jgi:hypothetical protein
MFENISLCLIEKLPKAVTDSKKLHKVRYDLTKENEEENHKIYRTITPKIDLIENVFCIKMY